METFKKMKLERTEATPARMGRWLTIGGGVVVGAWVIAIVAGSLIGENVEEQSHEAGINLLGTYRYTGQQYIDAIIEQQTAIDDQVKNLAGDYYDELNGAWFNDAEIIEQKMAEHLDWFADATKNINNADGNYKEVQELRQRFRDMSHMTGVRYKGMNTTIAFLTSYNAFRDAGNEAAFSEYYGTQFNVSDTQQLTVLAGDSEFTPHNNYMFSPLGQYTVRIKEQCGNGAATKDFPFTVDDDDVVSVPTICG